MSDFQELQQLVQTTRRERGLRSDAKAFVWLCLERVVGLAEGEIPDSVTHGELDGGIDAVHVGDEGVHIVACDYAAGWLRSKRTIPRERLDRFVDTWLAIASSRDDELALGAPLRRRVAQVKSYWKRFDTGHIPHTFCFLTNREHDGIPRAATERRLNYYMMHTYRYLAQEELAKALLTAPED